MKQKLSAQLFEVGSPDKLKLSSMEVTIKVLKNLASLSGTVIVVEFSSDLKLNMLKFSVVSPSSFSPELASAVNTQSQCLVRDSEVLSLGEKDWYYEGGGSLVIAKDTIILSVTVLYPPKLISETDEEDTPSSNFQTIVRLY